MRRRWVEREKGGDPAPAWWKELLDGHLLVVLAQCCKY